MARKSLGTLTLDLVAKIGGFEAGLDKAGRKARTTSGSIEKSFNQASKAIAGMSVAAVGGLAALVTNTAESAREIKNLSTLAGASTQEFQRLSFAAARFGVEQDKVSDILKDTNDRIGDFIQTGGGPMADFFENIAPLVGVTADEFARLSGPDALRLYVDSLEKAEVSQKDMTFYMEAIAGDAAKLIPLLQNNGAEFKRLGDEAERTGNVFSDMDFAELEKITRSTDELQASLKGVGNEIALAAIPAINDLTDLLGDEATIESAKALGSAIVTSMNFVIGAIDGAVKVTQFLAEELAAFIHGPAFDDIPRLTEKLEDVNGALAEQEERLRRLRETPNLVPKEVIANEEERLRLIQAESDALQKLIDTARDAESASLGAGSGVGAVTVPDAPTVATGAGAAGGISRTGKEAREAAEGLKELEQSLSDMRAEFDPAMEEFNRYADQIDLIEQYNITAVEKEKLREDAFEAHQQRMSEIAGESAEKQLEVQASYWEQYLAAAEENLQSFDVLAGNMLENFSGRFGNAFESVVFDAETMGDAIDGLAEGMARSVVNAIGEMTAQWLAFQAVQLAVGKTTSAAAIGEATAAGAAIAAAYGPAAVAASLATSGTNSVGAIAGISATTSAMQASNLIGMAHDGMDEVPKTGTWLLEKGERVVTAETSAKLDKKLDESGAMGGSGNVEVTNVFQISAGVAGTVRAEFMKMMPMIEERSKASVLQAINNGGPMARATGRRR